MRNKFLWLIPLSIIFVSCDVAQVLIIKNSGNRDSSVAVYAQKSIFPLASVNDTSKIVIHSPGVDSLNPEKTEFFYGIGGWSDDDISSMALGIDSIIIRDADTKTVYNTPKVIEAYLLEHRRGLGKSMLRIGVK